MGLSKPKQKGRCGSFQVLICLEGHNKPKTLCTKLTPDCCDKIFFFGDRVKNLCLLIRKKLIKVSTEPVAGVVQAPANISVTQKDNVQG